MIDSFNGFGGMASNCLNVIKEEFPKKSIFSILPFPYFKNLVTHLLKIVFFSCQIF